MTKWRVIPGFSAYVISEDGIVKLEKPWWRWQRKPTGSLIKISNYDNKEGYLAALLRADDNSYTRVKIHVAVTLAFHGPKPSKDHCACHKDDNRRNNHYTNLYWGTKKQNAIDRSINGHSEIAKLTPEQVLWARELYWIDKWTYKELSDLFDVSTGVISQVIKHRTYLWVRGSYPTGFPDVSTQI